MATCKNCGKPLILSGGRCLYCGKAPNGQTPINKCPNCGIPLPEGAKFCYNCGAHMSGNGTPKDLPLRIEYGNVFCKLTKLAGGTGFTGTIEIPPYIDGQKVTAIGERAFWSNDGLTSVTIPNTVTNIGREAFWNCGLLEIALPDSVVSIGPYAFSGCFNLTNLVIPNSVVSIDYGAFSDCQNLTKIVIPSSVRHIGNSAFNGCRATSIIVPPTVEINNYTFSGVCRECDFDQSVSVVFPKKYLCKSIIRNLRGFHDEWWFKRVSIKDEFGNTVKYEDLP